MSIWHPSVLAFLLTSAGISAQPIIDPEVLRHAPEQPVVRQYRRNFPYQHDKGFLLSLAFGPSWNQALQNPSASALRFSGQIGVGFVPTRNLAIHANLWGNYLEPASLWSAGPGITYFFAPSHIAMGLKLGLGNVSGKGSENKTFRETVLATEFSIAKYWWISGSNSLGLSWVTGFYGLTLSQGAFSSVGWSTGLRIEYVYN